MSQFYALMHDNTVKYISLREEIIADIRNLFINGGAVLKPEGIEEDEFDGNIVSRNGENITYVNYNLPDKSGKTKRSTLQKRRVSKSTKTTRTKKR